MFIKDLIQALGNMETSDIKSIVRILCFVVYALGYYKIFQKAGEAGWKAFIPFYSDFVRFKISWNVKPFWIALITSLLIYFLPSDYLITGLLIWVCMIVNLVINIKRDICIAKSFGKSKGWGVLLFFFPFVISLILGYGKAQYIGNTTVKKEN
jgi:hypothetical protein